MFKKDRTIIDRCIKGDQKAMMHLYDTYCKAMFVIASRYLKKEEDAKDAMQEGFLKAFINIENYTNDYSFGTWLKRIVINQCLDALRKRQLNLVEVDAGHLESICDDVNEDWSVDGAISKETILNAIEKLTDKYKLVVQLYLIEGYDHIEISQILGIPIKTSRTHLRRGRMHLKEYLKQEYHEKRH